MELQTWQVISGLAITFSGGVLVVSRWIHADMRREIARITKQWEDFERIRTAEVSGLSGRLDGFVRQIDEVKASAIRAGAEDCARAIGVLEKQVAADLTLAKVTLEARIKEVDTERARGDDQLNAKHGQLRNDQKRMERDHDADIKTLHATFGRGKLYDHDDPRT